jgi:hypothetical protein
MPIKGNLQSAKIVNNQVTWSDGTPFDGFIRLGLVVPQYGGTVNAPFLASQHVTPALELPLNTLIFITNGQPDTSTGVVYNTSISPPNSQYVAWWYDAAGHLLAGPSAQFSITSSPFTPPTVTLTAPSVGSTIPPSKDA